MLTKAGIRLIDEAVVAHLRNQAEVLSPLTAAEQEQLSRLLGKLLKAYE